MQRRPPSLRPPSRRRLPPRQQIPKRATPVQRARVAVAHAPAHPPKLWRQQQPHRLRLKLRAKKLQRQPSRRSAGSLSQSPKQSKPKPAPRVAATAAQPKRAMLIQIPMAVRHSAMTVRFRPFYFAQRASTPSPSCK